MLPISKPPGLPKQAGLIAKANPVASLEPTSLFGSQSMTGRAFISPPLKSVIAVEVQVAVFAVVLVDV